MYGVLFAHRCYFALNVLHSVSFAVVALFPPTSMHDAVQRFDSLYVHFVASQMIPDIQPQLCFSITNYTSFIKNLLVQMYFALFL